jgi:hypothetical protein
MCVSIKPGMISDIGTLSILIFGLVSGEHRLNLALIIHYKSSILCVTVALSICSHKMQDISVKNFHLVMAIGD